MTLIDNSVATTYRGMGQLRLKKNKNKKQFGTTYNQSTPHLI